MCAIPFRNPRSMALMLAGALGLIRNVLSYEVQIGPDVKLPNGYDVQVLPSVPVHVNVSVLLFEVLSVDEPKQVENVQFKFSEKLDTLKLRYFFCR